MKFLSLSVDISSASFDPPSKRPAHADLKEGYHLKSSHFSAIGLPRVKTVADRHRHAAYHNKRW